MDSESQQVRNYSIESQDHGSATGSPRRLQQSDCMFCRRAFTRDTEPSEGFEFRLCRDCRFFLVNDTDIPSTASREPSQRRSQRQVRFGLFQTVEDIIHQEFGALPDPPNEYESDASLDGDSYPNRDFFVGQGNDNHVSSDTDIDPMHVGGQYQWTSDYDDYNEDDDSDWEEADVEEEASELLAGDERQTHFTSNNSIGGSLRDTHNAGFHSLVHDRFSTHYPDLLTDDGMDEPELPQLFDNSGDYRDTISYEELLEHIGPEYPQLLDNLGDYRDTISREEIVEHIEPGYYQLLDDSGNYLNNTGYEDVLEHTGETDGARRWPPPAADSCFRTLPLVNISKVHEKNGDLICAICTDPLPMGTEANHLPCLHFYHPLCIIQWLCKRNTCPVCRYELPTDDPDYEDSKRNNGRIGESSSAIPTAAGTGEQSAEFSQRIEGQNEFLDSEPSEGNSNRQRGRRGWTHLATAAAMPVLSIVGMILVMWLGASLADESTHILQIPDSQDHSRN